MSLVEVKNKIQSTKNTRKITKAMQLVAANKMKFFQKKAFASREYAWNLIESLVELHKGFKGLGFGEVRKDGPTLFIIITSDKGLCGALNNRLAKELFESEAWKSLDPKDRLLITVGKKSKQVAKRLGYEIEKSYEGIREEMTAYSALKLVAKFLHYWEEGRVKKIILVSPHFVNPFDIKTTQKQYLPLTQEMINSHFNLRGVKVDDDGSSEIDDENLEPGPERMRDALAFQLVNSIFIQSFYELKASEYSSRMVAMKKATESAEEMIDTLTLDYNKARQAKITQELSELAAGSAAQVN